LKRLRNLFITGIIINLLTIFAIAGNFNPQNISIPQGLSHSNVFSILQDKYGFLWVATMDGLNRYDGYNFKKFKNVPGNPNSLIEDQVWDIAEDKKGNLWIATHGGVSFYNRIENKFTQYDIEDLLSTNDSSNPQAVSVLIDNQGGIWIGTVGGGVIKYNREEDKFENVEFDVKPHNGEFGLHVVFPLLEFQGSIFAGDFTNGLVKYDRQGQAFREVNFNSDKIVPDFTGTDERISALYGDQNGVLWIVTEYGIYKYRLADNKIWQIKKFASRDIFQLWRLYSGICQDAEGNIWIGKDGRGLYKVDGISDDIKRIPFGQEYKQKPNVYNKMIISMFTDNTGIIWMGTMLEGLFKFDPASEPFTHHINDPENPRSISGNEAFGLLESSVYPNTIYVGIRGSGLDMYNHVNGDFKKVNIDFDTDMFGGSVRAILEETDGSLYIGSWGDGLLKYSLKEGTKIISKWDSTDNRTISHDLVRVLRRDGDGLIWIGTNFGLNVYEPESGKLNRIYSTDIPEYQQDLIDIVRDKHNKSQAMISILEVGEAEKLRKEFTIDRPRDFLVVSVGEGLRDSLCADYGWIEDPKGDKVWSSEQLRDTYYLNGADKNRITIDLVKLIPGKYSLNYRSDDSHSFGSWNAGAPIDSTMWGIQIFKIGDTESRKIKNYLTQSKNQPLISGPNIRSIHMDHRNNNIVWIGTDADGLNRFDKSNGSVKYYQYDSENSNTVSNNSIQFIHEDNQGILWLATNSGLNRFDPVKEEFSVFREEDGLPTNYIASILEDDSGDLWLATRNGLSRMNYSNGRATFVNYDADDGLGGGDFIAQVALKSSNGRLYFGGDHGLNEFFPGKMNTNPPRILLTDLRIGNKSISTMAEDLPIDSTIYETDEITLKYGDNDLSFEYAALHFGRSEKNQYAHMLEGYDEEWSYDNRRFATYTNLDPGKYIFKIRGSNSDGVWNNQGKQLNITILPPWWQTIWAYFGYGFIFLGIIFGVDRIQRRRILARERNRQVIHESELRAEAAELQAKASEAERRAISLEYEQKKRELEEARDLQLSMLPKELPQLPNLDIAVYMKTATEVGGDYYDFNVSMDGTLTVVVGDATGHGMKAGTMVTAAKSLFNTHAHNPDILFTFNEITRCIKTMHMKMLSMCLTIMKIQGNKMIMSAAGMPPALFYNREVQSTEEIVIKGMPLGTFKDYPYELQERTLAPGDTILLMSDGMPELFNKDKEMFGYKRIRDTFEEVVEKQPEDIIDHLKNTGSLWADDEDPNDDVTFVVLKVK